MNKKTIIQLAVFTLICSFKPIVVKADAQDSFIRACVSAFNADDFKGWKNCQDPKVLARAKGNDQILQMSFKSMRNDAGDVALDKLTKSCDDKIAAKLAKLKTAHSPKLPPMKHAYYEGTSTKFGKMGLRFDLTNTAKGWKITSFNHIACSENPDCNKPLDCL